MLLDVGFVATNAVACPGGVAAALEVVALTTGEDAPPPEALTANTWKS
jgi:hypothetical protein